jgi:hypothetical protein
MPYSVTICAFYGSGIEGYTLIVRKEYLALSPFPITITFSFVVSIEHPPVDSSASSNP